MNRINKFKMSTNYSVRYQNRTNSSISSPPALSSREIEFKSWLSRLTDSCQYSSTFSLLTYLFSCYAME